MGGGVASYFVEGEEPKQVANKLRALSDKLLGNGKFNVLDLEATSYVLQFCQEIKFRQDAVNDNDEGKALSLLLKSLLYHSQDLGISDVPVGDLLCPFKLDNLTFPRMSQPRPSTHTIVGVIDWQSNSAPAAAVPHIDADYLFQFPSFGGVDSFWVRFDNYLGFLQKASADINAMLPFSVEFQVKDLNGTLDKLIYRSKNGTDLLRCRFDDVDSLRAFLESQLGFHCVEDACNAIGVRVLKLCRTVSYGDLENVPIWIEVAEGYSHHEEQEHISVGAGNPLDNMSEETRQHVAYEVMRMHADYSPEHLQHLAHTFEPMEVEIIEFQRLLDAKPVVRSRLLMEMDQQQAMLAGKYGGTCS